MEDRATFFSGKVNLGANGLGVVVAGGLSTVVFDIKFSLCPHFLK